MSSKCSARLRGRQIRGRQPDCDVNQEEAMHALRTFIIGAAVALAGAAQAQDIDWTKVDTALGRKATISGDVHRYGFPRTDLTATLHGAPRRQSLALGSRFTFKPAHGAAMVM